MSLTKWEVHMTSRNLRANKVWIGVLVLTLVPSFVIGDDIGPMSVRSAGGQAGMSGGPDRLPIWSSGAPMPAGAGVVRYAWAQCPERPESVYLFSGVDESFSPTANSWRYDADSDAWFALAPIPIALEGPAAVCWEGRIFVLGGGGTDSHQVYDVATNSWSLGVPLPRPVWGAAAGAWDGKIFMVGGDADFFFGGTSGEVNIYDVATSTWIGTGAPMPTAAVTAGWAQAGSLLYLAGGWGDSSPTNNVTATQRYDMSTDSWHMGPAFTSGRADLKLAVSRDHLFAAGGDADGGAAFDATDLVEFMSHTDWPTSSWQDLGDPLPAPLTASWSGACTMTMSGGEIWSQAGWSGGFIVGVNDYLSIGEPCFHAFDADVLVVQDFAPWGFSSAQEVLTINAIPFHQITVGQLATVDFSPYSLVLVSSAQGSPFYDIWNAHIARVTQFVGDGGWLILSAANMEFDTPPLIPGGVIGGWDIDNINLVAEPGHAWVAGVPQTILGTSASHRSFTNLLPGTTVVVTAQTSALPTLLDYDFGLGRVMASGMPLEWGWAWGEDSGLILFNAIRDMHPAIFADGFESGDVFVWSSATP
jgi:hypothetical protein